MKSRNYYRVRAGVRLVFWSGVAIASLYALQLFIVALWALQF